MTLDEVSAITNLADFNCSGKLDYKKVWQTVILGVLDVTGSNGIIKCSTYQFRVLVHRWPYPSPPAPYVLQHGMSSGMYFCFPHFFWQGTALAIFLAASEPNALGRG